MPEGADATTELSREHAEIEKLVLRIATLEPCPERTLLVREATSRFLTHARAEEKYLLPAFRRFLPGGEREAVEQERHVQDVRATVEGLEHSDSDDEFNALVGGFVLDAQRHIERQDAVLLPALLDAAGREELNLIGRQMRHALTAERDGGR
jgi:hypothetical protein